MKDTKSLQYGPREKLLVYGIENLGVKDLLGALIGSGVGGRTYAKIAGSVSRLIRRRIRSQQQVTLEDLQGITGIGEAKAIMILAGLELGKRLYGCDQVREKTYVSNSSQAYEQLKWIGSKKKEYAVALYLNARMELIAREIIAVGRLNAVHISLRSLAIPALMHNALYVILAHNHPSGGADASPQDIEITRKAKEVLALLDIVLLDHLIITPTGWAVVGDTTDSYM